jgi:hypothetical protein
MSYTNGLDKPDLYFNTVLWTGNGTSQSITGVNFQPDLSWIKSRTTTDTNAWYDAVRGATIRLKSNATDAETTQSTALTSFDSDGFSIGAGGDVNTSSADYVAWNWLGANGTASNTDGSITSTVSANTTSGFSIVSFTSTGSTSTVGHGLGVTPDVYIIKNRSAVEPWFVYTTKIDGSLDYLRLNQTDGKVDFGLSAPTSSVFSTDNGSSGNSIIAYCFAEKKGFSKFGSYTGNGSSDGTFVYTGFRPAMVITKSSSNSGASYNWQIWDNKRNTYNAVDTQLRPNTSESDNTDISYSMDFVSNGFKMRGTNTNQNGSGSTYIYMCFAENPLVSSTGIPTCAR